MTIKTADAVSVGALLELKQRLRIPDYQRPYSWEPATALQLVDDVIDAERRADDVPYVLGAVILHRRKPDHGSVIFDVVDGQQRLLTLRMISAILKSEPLFSDVDDHAPVILVWKELSRRLKDEENRPDLLQFMSDRCQLVRIVTDDVDEAFRLFDSQNYRGKSLNPHDLLKAHHLREMQDHDGTDVKVKVVEAWESAGDDKLDRLFSTFLWRIARWSRGERALGFTSHDIGTFKGISIKNKSRLSPIEWYHFAAQAVLPHERDAQQRLFQLDAPVVAGRPFFDMVKSMLEDLNKLEEEIGKKERFSEFGPSENRYRYVYELFIAALLYYTSKFGRDEDFHKACNTMFRWAYSLRVKLLRVQRASVDNWGRGKDDSTKSPFISLRNALTGRVIRGISTEIDPNGNAHEKELADFMKGLEEL